MTGRITILLLLLSAFLCETHAQMRAKMPRPRTDDAPAALAPMDRGTTQAARPASPVAARAAAAPVRRAASSNKPLSSGDVVTYQVLEDGDPAVQLVVSDAGELEIPYYGRVNVRGKTTAQVEAMVRSLLQKELYHQATVRVSLDQVAPSDSVLGQVYISGEVNVPGPQNIYAAEEATAGKLVLRAGGMGQFADDRRVKVVRPLPEGGTREIKVDLKDVLERGKVDKDVRVKPGDYIIVPRRLFNW